MTVIKDSLRRWQMLARHSRHVIHHPSFLGIYIPKYLQSISMYATRTRDSQYPEQLTEAIVSGYLAPYLELTPSADAAISEIESWLPHSTEIGFDHFAFRTFGVDSVGMSSVARWFTSLNYQKGGEFEFPNKKLRAQWYKPPIPLLPRVFVSELKVEEMTKRSQSIIQKYVKNSDNAIGFLGPATGFMGVTPWSVPSIEDYDTLLEESEYAAWVLVNGYALNHTTIAVHRLAGLKGGIQALNAHLKSKGFELSQEGGEIKVSPDGKLLQSSTVADGREFEFSGGQTRMVPGSYIEFAERLPLPKYEHLKPEELQEWHRRDGFEAANADKIFESTSATSQRLKK